VKAGVLDLRTVAPLDRDALYREVKKSGRLVAVDEDYRGFGLAAELGACLLEAGVSFRYARVCTEDTVPYARPLEDAALPNVRRIVEAARSLE
jgi:pyruvate dehydrogenase E1 component beta subunit